MDPNKTAELNSLLRQLRRRDFGDEFQGTPMLMPGVSGGRVDKMLARIEETLGDEKTEEIAARIRAVEVEARIGEARQLWGVLQGVLPERGLNDLPKDAIARMLDYSLRAELRLAEADVAALNKEPGMSAAAMDNRIKAVVARQSEPKKLPPGPQTPNTLLGGGNKDRTPKARGAAASVANAYRDPDKRGWEL